MIEYMDNNIEEKLKNLEEWNEERRRIKPVIDVAVDFHNKARTEARWKNYEQAANFYRKAIKNYKTALSLHPRYYFQDILDRVDYIIEEHVNNAFNLKISGEKLKTEGGIREFVEFLDNLKPEEKRYIDPYDIAHVFLRVGDLYYEERDLEKAYRFYNRAIESNCDRPFVNREAYFKSARILFDQKRYKEALVSFVSVLSFDRENKEVISHIEDCLSRLGISEHRRKFLAATPKDARKLIMEVL